MQLKGNTLDLIDTYATKMRRGKKVKRKTVSITHKHGLPHILLPEMWDGIEELGHCRNHMRPSFCSA